MAIFRLLHCSDLHLSAKPLTYGVPDVFSAVAGRRWGRLDTVSSQDPEVVDAFASFAYEYRQCYDAIVISGDLATTGDHVDLSEAVILADRPAPTGYWTDEGRPTLQAAERPILVIPGNHDRFGSRPLHSPGSSNFDHAFRHRWYVQQSAQELGVYTRDGSVLVVLGADLTLSAEELGDGPWGYLGQGRAYSDRVRTLCELTHAARRRYNTPAVVWLIHFDPSADNASLRLLDADVFRHAASTERVDAVLCGHTHDHGRKTLGGIPLFVCGTTTQAYAPSGNYLNLLEIEVGAAAASPGISTRTFRFDAEREKQFVPLS